MTIEEKLQITIEALKQCTIPSGAYNTDRLIHAENCIKKMEDLAKKALEEIGVDFSDVKIDQS